MLGIKISCVQHLHPAGEKFLIYPCENEGDRMKKQIKDPNGGLTAAGRVYFKKKQGSNLKPGVKGPADTVEKQKRKGSFLTRMFTHPRGPLTDKDGKPTRLALSARAWGEAAPKTKAAARKLAEKGRRLLDRAKRSQLRKQAA